MTKPVTAADIAKARADIERWNEENALEWGVAISGNGQEWLAAWQCPVTFNRYQATGKTISDALAALIEENAIEEKVAYAKREEAKNRESIARDAAIDAKIAAARAKYPLPGDDQ